MPRPVRTDRADLRRFTRELIGSRGRFALLCLAAVVAATVEAVLLAAVVEVALALTESGSTTITVPGPGWEWGVGVVLAVAIALAVVKIGAGALGARLTAELSTDTLVRLRTDLYAAFVRASWSRQSVERVGTFQELLGSHTRQASAAVLFGATAAYSAVNFVVLVAVAVLVQPPAAGLMLVAVVLLYVLLRPVTRLAYDAARRSSEAGVAYTNTTVELTDMAEEVATFDVGPRAEAVVADELDTVARPQYRAELMARLLPELYTSTALLVIFAGLALIAALDTTGLGSLGVVVVLLVRALTRAQGAQNAWHRVTEFLPYTDRLLAHRDELRAHAEGRGGEPVGRVGRLELDGVGYGYDGGERVLHEVSLAVEPGEALGVVGPSGSGKTTLLEVVLRLRSPQQGHYRVNGVDAATLDRAELTRRMAFVPQVPRLLTATVADNIRFLRPDVSDEAVREAARLAHIADEIEALEHGWDTVISDRGRGLSGGQRQRVCLARALAGDPDLLVLDEPTSALDSRSEELLCQSLAALVGEVTVLLVAHRASTLALCDRVVVLVDGRVEAVARPEQVAASDDLVRAALDVAD